MARQLFEAIRSQEAALGLLRLSACRWRSARVYARRSCCLDRGARQIERQGDLELAGSWRRPERFWLDGCSRDRRNPPVYRVSLDGAGQRAGIGRQAALALRQKLERN